MHWLARAGIVVGGNALALWIADRFVAGFGLSSNWITIILIAIILSLLNFFLKPVLTLVFGPVILLTLGLGVIIVNAIILWLLPVIAGNIDFLKGSIIIQDVPALLEATIIVGVINFIIHLAL
jgi:putative membrane protein